MAGVGSGRAVLLALAVAACSSQERAGRDAAGSSAVDGTVIILIGPGVDAAPPRPDAQAQMPVGFSFPDPFTVRCGGELPDALCVAALPAPVCGQAECADADTCPRDSWVAFYENPRCVDGGCQWDRAFYQCSGIATCQLGACYGFNPTLP